MPWRSGATRSACSQRVQQDGRGARRFAPEAAKPVYVHGMAEMASGVLHTSERLNPISVGHLKLEESARGTRSAHREPALGGSWRTRRRRSSGAETRGLTPRPETGGQQPAGGTRIHEARPAQAPYRAEILQDVTSPAAAAASRSDQSRQAAEDARMIPAAAIADHCGNRPALGGGPLPARLASHHAGPRVIGNLCHGRRRSTAWGRHFPKNGREFRHQTAIPRSGGTGKEHGCTWKWARQRWHSSVGASMASLFPARLQHKRKRRRQSALHWVRPTASRHERQKSPRTSDGGR